MIDLKLGALACAAAALVANVPATTEADMTDAVGAARAFAGLGATGIIGFLMYRQMTAHGAAIDRNTDAVDRMREHCSARNGEAPERHTAPRG
jgi:hypothetical protein